MNAAGRKVLTEIYEKLTEYRDCLEEIKSDEEAKLDNMPDGLRDSCKGEELEEIISKLDEAYTSLDSCCDELGELL